MNVLRLFWLIPCAVFLAAPASTTFAAESACVKCHTSDSTLKSLFTPPTPTGGEEGEG